MQRSARLDVLGGVDNPPGWSSNRDSSSVLLEILLVFLVVLPRFALRCLSHEAHHFRLTHLVVTHIATLGATLALGCSAEFSSIDPLDPAAAPEEVWHEGELDEDGHPIDDALAPPPGEEWPDSPEVWADEASLPMGEMDDELGVSQQGLSIGVFQLPFPCGQVWVGQTRTNHSPQNSVDFNRANDLGDAVVAAASGRVTVVGNTGSTSYGRWVEIDHGDGYRTRYAHLSAVAVSNGQRVTRGDRIGAVGTTGGSTGPHLHYEVRRYGVAVRPVFNGSRATFFGTRNYRSANRCRTSSSGANGTVRTSGAALTVRSGPGTGYAAVGSLPNRSSVRIRCHAAGSRVRGTYGSSTLWDRVGDGYVSDAYVYTGSDGRVAPWCP